MGSRFLDKRFTVQDGFSKGQGDDSPAVFFDGDTAVVTRPLNVEGLVTATMAIVGSLTAGAFKAGALTATAGGFATITSGSANIGPVVIGKTAGDNLISHIWRTIYTWNVPAIAGVYGSLSGVVSQDVAVSGAAIGDVIVVSPIGSYDLGVSFFGACYSAGAVNLRAQCISTLADTVGNVPLKIVDIQI